MNSKQFAIALFIFSIMTTACFSHSADNYSCDNNSDCFKGERCVESVCTPINESMFVVDTSEDDGINYIDTQETGKQPGFFKKCPGRMTTVPQKREWDQHFKALTTEVTQCLWTQLVENNPAFHNGNVKPVERLGFYEVLKFTNLLSEAYGYESCYKLKECGANLGAGCEPETKRCSVDFECIKAEFKGVDCEGFRLPTEAEWEYIARSRSRQEQYGNPDRIACYRSTSRGGTCSVKSKDPNHWGLYDTLGNVWELTWGNYQTPPKPPQKEPLKPSGWGWVSARGGGFGDNKGSIRFGNRGFLLIKEKSNTVGFRIVRTISQ